MSINMPLKITDTDHKNKSLSITSKTTKLNVNNIVESKYSDDNVGISAPDSNNNSEVIAPSSSKCSDSEQAQLEKQFLTELLREKQLRQSTFIELWRYCSGCTFSGRLAIYCDWLYANVNAKVALLGISSVVPFFAWFTKLFWKALVSQLIVLALVWLFVKFVFGAPTNSITREADKFNKNLLEQSRMHLSKMLKLKDKLKILNIQKMSPTVNLSGEEDEEEEQNNDKDD